MKKKKDREKRKRFNLSGRFQNWKQISKVLLRDQGFYKMYEGFFLQTRFSKILLILGRAFASKHAAKPLKHSPKLLKHSLKLLKHSPKPLKHSPKLLKHSPKLLKHSVKLLKHSPNFWSFKKKLKARPRVWKVLPQVYVITRPMLSQSIAEIWPSCLRGCLDEF